MTLALPPFARDGEKASVRTLVLTPLEPGFGTSDLRTDELYTIAMSETFWGRVRRPPRRHARDKRMPRILMANREGSFDREILNEMGELRRALPRSTSAVGAAS